MSYKRIKWVILAGSLVPAGILALRLATHTAGNNPVEAITYETGDWGMIFLLATLAVTPLRKISGAHQIISLRRTFGLLTFFYVLVHFLTYICLAQALQPHRILDDLRKRPFIALGFCAFFLMIPLAITSNRVSIRRLGKHWTRLHRWIYVIAILAVLHYSWMRKGEAKPFLYALLFSSALGWRVRLWAAKRWPSTQRKVFLVDQED